MKLVCPKCHFNVPDHLLRATATHPRGEVGCPNCAAVSALPNVKWWPAVVGVAVFLATLLFRNSLGISYLAQLALQVASTAVTLLTLFWSYKAGKLALRDNVA